MAEISVADSLITDLHGGLGLLVGQHTPEDQDGAGSAPAHAWPPATPTTGPPVYAAFVIDAYSRRILDWRAATHQKTSLVLDAFGAGDLERARDGVIGLVKTELVKPAGPWRTAEHVEIATLEYVGWFDHRRLDETCGNRRPGWRRRSTLNKHPSPRPCSQQPAFCAARPRKSGHNVVPSP